MQGIGAPLRDAASYFFFLAAGFFFAAAFLVAFFIDYDSPIEIQRFKKSQCDSYIESPRKNVKKKMQCDGHSHIRFMRARDGEGIRR